MSKKLRIALVVVALLVLGWRVLGPRLKPGGGGTAGATAAAIAARNDPPGMLGSLKFAPCTLKAGVLSSSGDGITAQCTTLQLPEDRTNPASRKIPVRVAWVPADQAADLQGDPLFFIAGGPGQSALSSYGRLAPVLRGVLRKRHVILVDQRGTGQSNVLKCDLGDDRATTPSPAEITALAKQCADSLAAKADLRFYTTTDAVADLEDVRKAIGAPKVNLYGVSYGTRVAQQYAMRHPDVTRSITLDSPVPNTLYLANIWAQNLEEALTLQFGLCAKDKACAAKIGDPRKELEALMTKLRAAPPMVSYRDARSGELKTEALTADEVAGMVRFYAYMPTMAALLPQLVHAANGGDYAPLKALTSYGKDMMKDEMAMAMQMSVICSEDGDHMATEVAKNDNAGTLLGNSTSEGMAAACKAWPRGNVPADFHQPLKTNVPALVLAGEFDPVTPPRYGKEIVKSLPNGRLLVLKGQGHNVIGAGCMPRLFTDFVDKADAKALDAKCLDRLNYSQPFTSWNGWSP